MRVLRCAQRRPAKRRADAASDRGRRASPAGARWCPRPTSRARRATASSRGAGPAGWRRPPPRVAPRARRAPSADGAPAARRGRRRPRARARRGPEGRAEQRAGPGPVGGQAPQAGRRVREEILLQRFLAAPLGREVGLGLVEELAAPRRLGDLARRHVGQPPPRQQPVRDGEQPLARLLLGLGRDPHGSILNVSALAISAGRGRASRRNMSVIAKLRDRVGSRQSGAFCKPPGKGKGPDRRPDGQVPSAEAPRARGPEDDRIGGVGVSTAGRGRRRALSGPVGGAMERNFRLSSEAASRSAQDRARM